MNDIFGMEEDEERALLQKSKDHIDVSVKGRK